MHECEVCKQRYDDLYYSCCGAPASGHCGHACDHNWGEIICHDCGVENGYWSDDPYPFDD